MYTVRYWVELRGVFVGGDMFAFSLLFFVLFCIVCVWGGYVLNIII